MKVKNCVVLASFLLVGAGNAMEVGKASIQDDQDPRGSEFFRGIVAHRLTRLNAQIGAEGMRKFFYACYDPKYKLDGSLLEEARSLDLIDKDGYVELGVRALVNKDRIVLSELGGTEKCIAVLGKFHLEAIPAGVTPVAAR